MLEINEFNNQIELMTKEVCKERGVDKLSADQGYDKYLRDATTYLNYYFKLFTHLQQTPPGTTPVYSEMNILDFGCGPAFSIYVGKIMGFQNIRGLDVNLAQMEIDSIIQKIHQSLQIESDIDFYKGYGTLPYPDSSQDIIMSMWSILGDYSLESGLSSWLSPEMGETEKGRLKNRLIELIRISGEESVWLINPKKHWDIIQSIYNEINHNKNIVINLVS